MIRALVSVTLSLFTCVALSINTANAKEQPFFDLTDAVQHLPFSNNFVSVQQAIDSDEWVHLNGNVDLGFVEGSSWFKIDVPVDISRRNLMILEIANLLLEDVRFYFAVNGEIFKEYQSGSLSKLTDRPIHSRNIAFQLEQIDPSQNAQVTVYLRIESESKIFLPIRVWTQRNYFVYEKAELIYSGIFLGAFLFNALYHFFLFVALRIRYALFYCFALLGVASNNLVNWGFAYEYLWGQQPVSSSIVHLFLLSFTTLVYTLFLLSLGDVANKSKLLNRFFLGFSGFAALLTVVIPFIPLNVSDSILAVHAPITKISLCALAIWLWTTKDDAGFYFLLTFTTIAIGEVISLTLKSAGSISPFLGYINSTSVFVAMGFLAIAIAKNIRKKELQVADEIYKLNDELEQKVRDRTASLKQSLQDLKATQKQLIEAEKSASITSLVRGVAHEINTPIGFCITAASKLHDDTLGMLHAFANNKLSRTNLSDFLNKSDHAMTIIKKGLERSANLVSQFKTLAVDNESLDENPINISKLIDNCVALLEHTEQQVPTINIKCDRTLTVISYPRLIDQLLKNLLSNSITHAFDKPSDGIIEILVELEGHHLKLTYSDNGKGLTDSQQQNLFNAFETTARGEGRAGLGTTVIYNIVSYGLKGEIAFSSSAGHGLTYNIKFPIKN